MTPHISAELFERRTGGDVHAQRWPTVDESKAAIETTTMVIQVNGKVRDKVEVDTGITEDEAVAVALGREKVQALLGEATPTRTICRPPKLVNLVL